MILHKMLHSLRSVNKIPNRTFKNFGHKRQPIPIPTTLWHGFLTFTFIASALKWDVISKFFFGDENLDDKLNEAMAIGKVDR